jgi:beta-glucanase (GH16 family)
MNTTNCDISSASTGISKRTEESNIRRRLTFFSHSTPLLIAAIFFLFMLTNKSFAAPPGDPSDWGLTFSDEFEGTSLDFSKWATTYPDGSRTNNDELEWYVDSAQLVSDGTLKLIAAYETVQQGYPYTSGMISSHNGFSQAYGYFEASMKIPSGYGLWPAFWLLPLPLNWPPEIDVMENLGKDPRRIYMYHHYSADYPYPGEPKGGSVGSSYYGSDYSTGFHTYGVEWSPAAITWYIDGVQRYRSTYKVPVVGYGVTGMYLLANLAVGGSWAGTPNPAIFPKQLEIDYIRVYERLVPDISAVITFPVDGATVSGTISVNVSASAGLGVAKVDLSLDGVFTASDTTQPYSFYLNTSRLPNGNHSLRATVTDTAGNMEPSADVKVNVSNVPDSAAPTITVTSPSNNSTIYSYQRYVTIKATAKDNAKVKQVRLLVDGKLYSTVNCDATTYYANFSWNLSGVPKGWHTISCDATDASGNIGVSSALKLNLR